MERYNFEKTIGEIDCLIKEHEKRENTFTMSVLQTCREYAEELKRMKDAEEQGLLKMLPCRAGDTVYLLWHGKIYERKVNGFSITSNNRLVVHVLDCDMDNATLPAEQFGKILFLSRESALAEKGGAE